MSSVAPLVPASPASRYVLGPQVRQVNLRAWPTTSLPTPPATLPDAKISLTPTVDEATYTLPTSIDAPPTGGHNHPIALHVVVMPGPITPELETQAVQASATAWAGSPFPKTSTPVLADHNGPYALPMPYNENAPAGSESVQSISQILMEFAS